MNSSSNLNIKNQPDTTDLEIGSFNEEEDQFINKKQLVHIDDDTSINVDISDDDRSKSSTLKKSFLINNMSAFNEQFPINNQLANKKNENDNDINDLTNSADFYNNSQNGIGSFPLMMSDRNKEILNKNKINNNIEDNNFDINNLNNNEMIQSLGTKIDNNGYFFSKENEQINEENNNINNINYLTNKKINIKNKDMNISIKDIDDEEEEEYSNDNNNIQKMLQKKMTPYTIMNENNNINNLNNKINYKNDFIQKSNNQNNNINYNNINKIPNFNNNRFNILKKSNFSLYILGINTSKFSGSVNTSEQTFGLMQSKEFQNKYAQLESKYNALLAQNKKLEENYEELKNSNKSVLDLLTYWQKFYLEILEIVKPKNPNKNDTSISDYMDDPYRIQVINDVKKIVLISRDKVYNNFYLSKNISFNFKGKEKEEKNKEDKNKSDINNFNDKNNLIQIESFTYRGKEKEKEKTIHKKNLNEEDDLNSLPPIRRKEKINTGINTDITGEIFNEPVIKEVIKEVEVIKKIPLQKFDKKSLNICSNIQNIFYKNIPSEKQDTKQKNILENINKNEPIIKSKPKISNTNSNSKLNIVKETKPLFSGLKIKSSITFNIKGQPPKTPKKFKKNIMHKIAIVQTDMTSKNINSIETLNKACSSQLLNSQREKEKMQKLYEDKIASLNNYINENLKSIKKEKNAKNCKNKEKNSKNNNDDENNNNLIKNKDNETPINLNSSFIFLPEMIPPENTYKIFIHCVKHFKYEEDIYKKYLEEEDLYTLKAFVEKMEKYLIGASLPVLKYNKKVKKEKDKEKSKDKNINDNYIKPENIIQKKYKDNNIIINHVRQKSSNSSKFKISSNSDNKVAGGENKINHIYNNNSTFNKYKAAIMALKDY